MSKQQTLIMLFLWAMILPEKKDFKRFDEKFIMAYYNTISKTCMKPKILQEKKQRKALIKYLNQESITIQTKYTYAKSVGITRKRNAHIRVLNVL